MSSPAGQAPTRTITSSSIYHKAASVVRISRLTDTKELIIAQRQPSISESTIHGQPTRPPGLLPLVGERLWKPHEDSYWASLREMWGSNVDLAETRDDNDRVRSVALAHNEAGQDDLKEDLLNADLCTENGTVFRIVLPNKPQSTTAERDNNHAPAGGRTSYGGTTGAPRRPSINHTPISDALALHLPPYVLPCTACTQNT